MSKHTLPELGYAYDSLEPFIDAKTMELHHSKHHQTYVDKLNAALEKYPDLQEKPLVDLLRNIDTVPSDIRTAIRNHGGGHYNHSFFWPLLKTNNGSLPEGDLAEAINITFGNFESFKKQFSDAATAHFGSGWVWLVHNGQDLSIVSTPNQDCPLSSGFMPILALDVWEHAYYLKYQNKRPEYIDAFWKIINWEQVRRNFEELV